MQRPPRSYRGDGCDAGRHVPFERGVQGFEVQIAADAAELFLRAERARPRHRRRAIGPLRQQFKLAEWSRQISMIIDSMALVKRNVRREALSDDGERLGQAFAQRAGSAGTRTIEPLATTSRGLSFDCISPAYE